MLAEFELGAHAESGNMRVCAAVENWVGLESISILENGNSRVCDPWKQICMQKQRSKIENWRPKTKNQKSKKNARPSKTENRILKLKIESEHAHMQNVPVSSAKTHAEMENRVTIADARSRAEMENKVVQQGVRVQKPEIEYVLQNAEADDEYLVLGIDCWRFWTGSS
jgi:hypothetical protein